MTGALVVFPGTAISRLTDEDGVVAGTGGVGRVPVRVSRIGYARLDTAVHVPGGSIGGEVPVVHELTITPSAVALSPLTVRADRRSVPMNQALFARESAVGAALITPREVRMVPPVAEADLFRSLQALPGVGGTDDFGAQLFVKGGGADQTHVFLDGAPIFGPYHLFGMFGAINPDVVGSTEVYQGSLPSRFGGALSGIVWTNHRLDGDEVTTVTGGLSTLGLRMTGEGGRDWRNLRWIVGGRTASTTGLDLSGISIPYAFHDANVAVELDAGDDDRLRLSAFRSADRFSWHLDRFGETLRSNWENTAASLTWSAVRGDDLAGNASVWWSRYGGELAAGDGAQPPATASEVSSGGVRAFVLRRGETFGFRLGFEASGGTARLSGEERAGAFFFGELGGSYLHASLFGEVEQWFGPVRISPGLRLGREWQTDRSFVVPHMSVRWAGSWMALSASLDRSYQFLSALHDGRYSVPGAPMWFAHGEDMPASVADGLSASFDVWGESGTWSARILAWTRTLDDIASFQPDAARDVSSVEFDDGSAHGIELSALAGWGPADLRASYQWSRVRLTDPGGTEYRPRWALSQELDATLRIEPAERWTLSARARFATGAPFWHPAGTFRGERHDPGDGRLGDGGYYIVWSEVQGDLPMYARVDVSTRYAIGLGRWRLEPYLSVMNLMGRENVLLYHSAARSGPSQGTATIVLSPISQLPRLPFIGIDLSFSP